MAERFELSLKTPAGTGILVLERTGRKYTVVSFEIPDHPELSLAFAPDGPGVENLDDNSDIAQCFNLSSKVRYNGVVMGSLEMRANSFEELQYALSRVKVRAFNHEEI